MYGHKLSGQTGYNLCMATNFQARLGTTCVWPQTFRPDCVQRPRMVTLKYSVTAGTSFQIIYVFPTIKQRECFQKIYERWGQRTFIEDSLQIGTLNVFCFSAMMTMMWQWQWWSEGEQEERGRLDAACRLGLPCLRFHPPSRLILIIETMMTMMMIMTMTMRKKNDVVREEHKTRWRQQDHHSPPKL